MNNSDKKFEEIERELFDWFGPFMIGRISYYATKNDDLIPACLKCLIDCRHMFNYLKKYKNHKNFNYRMEQIGKYLITIDSAIVGKKPNSYVRGFQFSRRMEQLKIANKLNLTIIS